MNERESKLSSLLQLLFFVSHIFLAYLEAFTLKQVQVFIMT